MEHNSNTQPPDIALSDTITTTTTTPHQLTPATPRISNARQTRTRARVQDHSTPEIASAGQASTSISQQDPTASVPTTTPRPRRSARISSSGIAAQEPDSAIQATISDSSKKSSSEGSSGDRQGKKRASSPTLNDDSPLDSSTSSKKRKSVEGTTPRAYGLRSKDEDATTTPLETEESSSVKPKGKGKAADKKGKRKSTALTMSKRPTPKGRKSSGPTAKDDNKAKKGDRSAQQLVDDSAEGDMSWLMGDGPGPSSRGMRDEDDEDEHMGGASNDDEDEDDDEHGDEDDEEELRRGQGLRMGDLMAGASGGPFGRLAQLASDSGMHLDEATAAALFGGDFRRFGGMSSGFSGRFKRLKQELQSSSTHLRLSALRECSEILLISNEDTLGGAFSVNAFATEFIAILNGKPNIDPNAPTKSSVGEDAAGMNEDEELAAVLAMSAGEARPGQSESEEEMESQLVACRCLAHLMEALPGTGHTLVHLGVVPVLCSKLNEISYIELAEQTLSTMEKISAEYPSAIVREGGLAALLNYLPFFSTNVQRTAITAAANCCRNISTEYYEKIRDVFPTLKETLTQGDQRLVEQATLAVVRTIEAYRHNGSHLDGLLDSPTIVAVNSLLMPSGGSPILSPSTYTHLLRALTMAARGSASVTIIMLEIGMTDTVYQILTGVLPPSHDEDEQGMSSGGQGLSGGVADMAVLQNLAHRPKDQVEETLAFICELLPPVPKDGVFDPKGYTEKALHRLKKGNRKTRSSRLSDRTEGETNVGDDGPTPASTGANTPVAAPALSDDAGPSTLAVPPSASGIIVPTIKDLSAKAKKDAEAQSEQRLELLKDHPTLIGKFIKAIVPVLVDVYAASVTMRVRTKVLNGLVKAIAFADADALRATLRSVPMASFLGAIISSKDNLAFVYCALQIVELLTTKLSDVYQTSFMREGVVYEIESLAKQELSTVKAAREKKAESTPTVVVKTEPEESPAAGPSSAIPPPRPISRPSLPDDLKPLLPAGMTAFLAAEGLLGTPTPSNKKSSSIMDPNDAVILRARVLGAKKLFDVAGDDSNEASVVLNKLSALVGQLCKPEASEIELYDALRETAGHFSAADSALSSFELIKGGVIDGLLEFVDINGVVSSSQRRSMLYEIFAESASSSSVSPITILVKRLHESLSRMEGFEVETAFGGASDPTRPSASMLSRTIRIKLVAEGGEEVPKHVSNLAVTIQAIAPLQALHDYLRPRVADANYMAGSGLSRMFAAYGGGGLGIPGGRPGGSASLLSALAAQRSASAGALLNPPAPPAAPAPAPELGSSAPESSGIAASAPAPILSPTTAPTGKTTRRRSARLNPQNSGSDATTSGANPAPIPSSLEVSGPGASSSSPPQATAALSSSAPQPTSFGNLAMDMNMNMDMDYDDEYSDEEYGEEVFEEDMEEELVRPQEKVVNMNVAPDGSRVEAKTPDGTRVATPSMLPGAASSSLLVPTVAGTSGSGTATPRTASYAGAVKAPATDWHLEFTLNGTKVSLNDTIYGIVHKNRAVLPGGVGSGGPYSASVTLVWRKVDGPAPSGLDATTDAPSPASEASAQVTGLDTSAPTTKILRLLRVVHNLTIEARAVSARNDQMEENLFINNKLTAKLTRQLEEVMILASGCLPDWAIELPKQFAFLFPFETRYAFLQATAFGYPRLIAKYTTAHQQQNRGGRRQDDLSHLARITRQKVRISRGQLLESCAKVMELYGTSPGILEIEYFDEIGTGLGPTLEFYSLASKAFSRRDLSLWRDEDESKPGAHVFHPKGLFPVTVTASEKPASDASSRLYWYKSLGIFIGRALLDSRIIDVNLNMVFVQLILDMPVKANIATLKQVDPQLARSLERLQSYLSARKEIESLPLPASAKRNKLMMLTVGGANLGDLSLDFTLPGTSLELKSGGGHIDVQDHNLEEYLDLVLDFTLGSGVARQVKAFQDGFSTIIPIDDIKIFSPEELGLLIGNTDEDWSRETLEQAIKADHGYNLDSRAVKNLVEIMSSYDKEERRAFLQFITGAPKLPIGGFRGLTPPFTVVRKPHEAPFKADDYLPSVMTCAQYLKMPDYSTKEVLAAQLDRAIKDGGGSFHLS